MLGALKVIGCIPCQVCYSVDYCVGAVNCRRGRLYCIQYCGIYIPFGKEGLWEAQEPFGFMLPV